MSPAIRRARASRLMPLVTVIGGSCRGEGPGDLDDAVHVDAGGDDGFRVEGAGGHDLVDLDDRDACGGQHHGAEVARGLAVDEVAELVGAVRGDECEVAGDGVLEDVAAAVEGARLLALGQRGAVAGGGEERGDAGAPRAESLGQVALRDELELEVPVAVGGVEVPGVGLARVGADDLGHAPLAHQRGEAGVPTTGVVAHEREVTGTAVDQRLDQLHGLPGRTEAADQDGRAVGRAGHGLERRVVELRPAHARPVGPGPESPAVVCSGSPSASI